jgi:hypothetical protein
VVATAQANRAVRSQATTAVAIDGYEELAVRWEPDSQSVAVGTTARLLLVIANRGNVPASYAIAADGDGATVGLPRRALLLAPGSSAQLPVTVDAAQAGAYTVAATVTSAGANAGDSATSPSPVRRRRRARSSCRCCSRRRRSRASRRLPPIGSSCR